MIAIAVGLAKLRQNVEERQARAAAFAGRLSGLIAGLKARGLSQRAMVAELNGAGSKPRRAGFGG